MPSNTKSSVSFVPSNVPDGIKTPVTKAFMGICIAAYVLQFFVPYPYAYYIDAQALSLAAISSGWWHTLITSMFMHGSIEHLLSNMIALYWLGSILERVYGSVKFLTLYLVSGLAGSVAFIVYAMTAHYQVSAVGASGAIFGMFAAYMYLLVREHHRVVVFVRPAAKSDVTSMLVLLAINLLMGFSPGIAWQAHVGGFAAGLATGAVLYAFAKAKAMKIRQARGML